MSKRAWARWYYVPPVRQGDRVYDEADQRHIGIIKSISITAKTATIRWEETGWLSVRWPVKGLHLIRKGDDR